MAAPAVVDWRASENLEIRRSRPDDPTSPLDCIGHRGGSGAENSPGTAIHTMVFTEGIFAAEFKVVKSNGDSGNGMYIGLTDGSADFLGSATGGNAWVISLNHGTLCRMMLGADSATSQ